MKLKKLESTWRKKEKRMKDHRNEKKYIDSILSLFLIGIFFVCPTYVLAFWQVSDSVSENDLKVSFVEADVDSAEDELLEPYIADFMLPGDSVRRSALIENLSDIDFTYNVQFDLTDGSKSLCNNLLLEAYRNDDVVYQGDLYDFYVKQSLDVGDTDLWKFSITLPLKASGTLQGLECDFNLVYDSFLNDVDSWKDREKVKNNKIDTGYWTPPEITILNPQFGTTWQMGQDMDISWHAESADPSKSSSMLIDIYYACDENPWEVVSMGENNDGSYTWQVPKIISDSCRFKMYTQDYYGYESELISNKFKISPMIALNEFLPYPGEGDEFVEIINYGPVAVDLEGWFITDSYGPKEHVRLIDDEHSSTGSTILPGKSDNIMLVEGYSSFYLNNEGSESLRLYDKNKELIDSCSFSDPEEGVSYSRMPDGYGNWDETNPTPGEYND